MVHTFKKNLLVGASKGQLVFNTAFLTPEAPSEKTSLVLI